MQSFDIEGITYFQQGRKCNKPGCGCSSGALHGPYWFSRIKATGQVSYIGRHLSEDVIKTREIRGDYMQAMLNELNQARAQVLAMKHLIAGDALSEDEYKIIRLMGFEYVLLSSRR